MCLIAFSLNDHPRFALALIANRDEFHARASLPAAPQPEDADIIGGRDLQAGGSWLQLSSRRRLAAITNLRQASRPPTRPRSRGALVVDFVRSNASASRFAAALAPDADAYGPHTLLLWDGRQLWQTGNHPAAHAAAVSPGLHALSNAELDARWPKSRRVQQALADWLDSMAATAGEPDTGALFAALFDATEAPERELPDTGIPRDWERRLSAIFIRGTDYGTRCSTVVLAEHGGDLWFEERRFGPNAMPDGTTRWHRAGQFDRASSPASGG